MPLKKKKQRRKVLQDDDVQFLHKLKEHSYTWYPFEYHQNYFEVLQEEHCTDDCSVDGCASHCTSEYEVFSKAYHILSKRVKAKA